MAGSVNKAIIIGRLGRDPEIRRMTSGDRVANLSVATSERWKDKQTGEKKERLEWHRVTIMNDALAGIAEKYLRKGLCVYIEGQIETRKWQDKDGQDRYSTEIVLRNYNGTLTLLDGPDGEKSGDDAPQSSGSKSADMDDGIPF